MRLGILGGTFDPVHVGHLVLAETARDQKALDEVIFVPAGIPWRKASREITPATHRLAMLRLAIKDNPAFTLSTIETDREGPSYTHLTLETLAREYPGSELYFILGADALADFPNWRRPERIVELATLVSARRPRDGSIAEPGGGQVAPGASIVWVDMPPLAISASEIRVRLKAGRSVRYLVPPLVGEYIAANGLYRQG